jgi:hypothetical protein
MLLVTVLQIASSIAFGIGLAPPTADTIVTVTLAVVVLLVLPPIFTCVSIYLSWKSAQVLVPLVGIGSGVLQNAMNGGWLVLAAFAGGLIAFIFNRLHSAREYAWSNRQWREDRVAARALGR